MKSHKKISQLFSYDLIRLRNHPTIESHLKILFNHLDINLVLDVGANKGQYGSMLRKKVGYQGHIISFEPVCSIFHDLQTNSADDAKWAVCNYGLGSSEEVLNINVTDSSDFSSFLEPNEFALKVRPSESRIDHTEEVTIKKLDDIFDEVISRIDIEIPRIFIKMDTQGFDHEVARGGLKTINRAYGLQSELSIIPIYNNIPTYVNSITLFRELGFEITGIYPMSRDNQTLQLIEADCIFKKILTLTYC